MNHPDIAALLSHATLHHREGRLAHAEQGYRRIVEANPAHAEAWGLLGLLLLQSGQSAAALALLDRSLRLRPGAADILGYRGLALKQLGRAAEAVESLRAALRRKPGSFELLYNLGNAQRDAGLHEAAAATYRRAIARQPGSVDAHNNLGNTLRQLGRTDEAAASFRRAIALDPNSAPLHVNLGMVLVQAGHSDLAVERFRTAVGLAPDNAEAWHGLAQALLASHRLAEAHEAGERSLALGNRSAALHGTIARIMVSQDQRPQALAQLRQAVASAPNIPQTHTELGMLLRDLGEDAQAVASLTHALQLQPNFALARYHLGVCHLLAGRLDQGWPLYEARMQANTGYQARFTQPIWRGEPIPGRTLLIHAEQGLGDTLQFCRFLPLVAAQSGATVILEVQPPLRTLMAAIPGIAAIVSAGDTLPAFDHHCPLPSLPIAFAATLSTLPAQVPYLAADPSRIAAWRARLADLPGLRIGLVWAGNPDYEHDDIRSLPVDSLAVLEGIAGVTFISLQKQRGAGPDGHPPSPIAKDWTAELVDMGETAALISALDLVIAADTALVHLAGALARPVWLLNRYDTDWRWLRDRTTDSPWYPTLRQFRQTRRGDWHQVCTDVRTALTLAAASGKP
jgi:tetratricopeptide (TPR) repeat protein